MQTTLRPTALPRYRTAVMTIAMACALTTVCHAQNQPANATPQDDIPVSIGTSAARDAGQDATYWRQHREGWFWYRDPVPAKARTPAKAPKRSSELADFDALQKRLEDLKRIAVMNPSDANLLAYMRLQRTVMDKSQTFADRWQRLVWSVPDLDYGMTGRPTNAMAINVFDDQQRSRDADTVRALAATHGLIFVLRSDCPFCHRFAPILKRFEQEFGITVLAVSMDGGTLPDYPDARPDNGIASRLQARSVPAVYLTQPSRREIRPVGFGLMSDSELLERVAALARNQTSDRSIPPSNGKATR
jgi:conjugal transfer pilus assembly protein TraF